MGIACLHVYFLQYAQYVEAAAPCGFIKGDGLLSQEADHNSLSSRCIGGICDRLQVQMFAAAFRLYPVSAKLGSSM